VQVYISANSTFDSAYPWYTPHTITRSITGKFVTSFLTADFIGFPTAYFNPYGQQVRGLDFLANYTTSPGMCFYGEGHTELFKLSAKNNTNIQNYIWTIGNDSTGYYNLTAITAGAGTFNVNIPTVLDLYPNIPITLVVTESANPGLSAGPFYYFDDTTGQQLPYPFYYSTKNLSGTENSLNNKFKQSIQVVGYTPPASSFSSGISGNSIFLPTNGVARLYNAYLRVSLSGYQASTLDACYDKYNLSWKWSTFEGCATNPTAFSNMASSWVTMQSAISAGSGNVYPAAYSPVYFTSTQLSALSGKYAKLWRNEGSSSTLSAEKFPITSYGSSIVWTLCTSKWAVQQVNPNTQTDYTFPLQSFTNGSTPYTASTYEDTPVEINVAQTITSVICAEPFDWLQKQYVYTDSGATNIISPGDFRIYTNNRYVLTGSQVSFENISLGFNDVDRIVIDLGNGTTTTLTGDQIYNNFSTTYATTGPKTLIATTYYIASRSVSPAVDTFTDIVEVISNYDTVDPEKYLTQETVLSLPWPKIPLVAPNDWAVEDNINSVFKKFYENLEYLDNRGNCYSSEPTEYSGWLGTIPININGISNCPLWTWEDVDCLAGGQDVAWEDTQQINDNFPTITTTGILASCALWDQHICSTAVLNPDCYGKYGIEWKWKSRKASSSSTTVTWKSTRVNSGYAKKWKLEPWINSDGEVITGQACDEGQWNVNIPKLSAYREPIVNCDSVSKCIYKNITSKDNILYVSLNNEIKLLSSDYSTTFLTSRLLIDDVNTFRSIKGLSLDTNGKLFVLDDVLNKVASYNIDPTSPIPFETYLSWGGYGSAKSKYGFLRPNDLHVDSTNNIWITDTGNKCVKKYSNTGTWLLTITDTAFASFEPISTSVDSSGYIHILTTQEVRVYDATGLYKSSYYFNDQTDSTPIKINTNYNHEIIYIVFSTQVLKYFKNGAFAGYLINNKQCATDINDVWQDEFRNVLVTSGDKIIKFVDLMTPKTIKGPLTDNYWSLSDLYINKDEYIQNWVYNKSFQRLWDNIEIFRQSLIFDNSTCGGYVGPVYAKDKIVIGLNEIVTSAVINRNINYLWQNFITLLNYFDPQCRKTSLNL